MTICRLILAAAILFMFPAAAFAQDGMTEEERQKLTNDSTLKDSVYFTLDDGVMSQKEMEEEAQYVYGTCGENAVLRTYIDCACFSGAFLKERETLGPTISQQQIMFTLVQKNPTCVNGPAVAGIIYKRCMNYYNVYSELTPQKEREEVCSCAGREVVRRFTRAPVADASYISSLSLSASMACEDPARRARITAENGVGAPSASPAAATAPVVPLRLPGDKAQTQQTQRTPVEEGQPAARRTQTNTQAQTPAPSSMPAAPAAN